VKKSDLLFLNRAPYETTDVASGPTFYFARCRGALLPEAGRRIAQKLTAGGDRRRFENLLFELKKKRKKKKEKKKKKNDSARARALACASAGAPYIHHVERTIIALDSSCEALAFCVCKSSSL
jgi:hypothetical protein